MGVCIREMLAPAGDGNPVVLVHGAANSASVWTFWQEKLAERGWSSYAVDLRGHGGSAGADLSRTGMSDYAADVVACARQLERPPLLVGWSMGGLVAMMAAEAVGARACVGLAPSVPTRSTKTSVTLRTGEFGPEEYGIVDRDPRHQPAMPDLDLDERRIALGSLGKESRLARDERSAGVVIPSMSAPCLLVTGTVDEYWPRERYEDFPLKAEFLSVEGASHWGLVLNRRVLGTLVSQVLQWLAKVRPA